jgi:hypothetical protein
MNKYDICTSNKIVNGKQCTIVWHVDDLKILHVNPNVVTDIMKQLELKYGTMSVTCGTKHTYVGINFKFDQDGTVQIKMCDCIKECIDEFPEEIKTSLTSPVATPLFDVNEDCEKLSKE